MEVDDRVEERNKLNLTFGIVSSPVYGADGLRSGRG